MKKIALKTLHILLAGCATFSVGLLSFVGMSMVVPGSLLICSSAFLLASVYEWQMNIKGVETAFERLFDRHYLHKKVIREFLKGQLDKQKVLATNSNLLESKGGPSGKPTHYVSFSELSKSKAETLGFYDNPGLPEEEFLGLMTKCLLRQMPPKRKELTTDLEEAAQYIWASEEGKHLLEEIRKKSWMLRLSSIFLIGGGASSALATLNGLAIGMASFSVAFLPAGPMALLAISAGIAYACLLYKACGEIIDTYGDNIRNAFKNTEGPKWLYYLRCGAMVLGIAITIVGTVLTAGMWWYGAKAGCELLGMLSRPAMRLSAFLSFCVLITTWGFGIVNAVESAARAFHPKNWKELCEKAGGLRNCLKGEKWASLLNPFRILANLLHWGTGALFFIMHSVSTGIQTAATIFKRVPVFVSTGILTVQELMDHFNFLPQGHDEHGHDHTPVVLELLFLPVTLVKWALQGAAVLWDCAAAGHWDMGQSYHKIFSPHFVEHASEAFEKMAALFEKMRHTVHGFFCKRPTPPRTLIDRAPSAAEEIERKNGMAQPKKLSPWAKQDVLETCYEIAERTNPEKAAVAEKIQEQVTQNGPLCQDDLLKWAAGFAKERYPSFLIFKAGEETHSTAQFKQCLTKHFAGAVPKGG